MDWFKNLTVLEHIYFWLGIVSTLFLVIQIVMMCFSSFGGDGDIDGDGVADSDLDADSGISIFTVKSITAFLAVGSWSGLLTCALASDKLQWLSIIVAVLTGAAALTAVAFSLHALKKLQCNGAVEYDKLVGQRANVYVSIPPSRSGRGKLTLNAQGKFMEIDAVTDETEKITVDEVIEIISIENECAVVKKIGGAETDVKVSQKKISD